MDCPVRARERQNGQLRRDPERKGQGLRAEDGAEKVGGRRTERRKLPTKLRDVVVEELKIVFYSVSGRMRCWGRGLVSGAGLGVPCVPLEALVGARGGGRRAPVALRSAGNPGRARCWETRARRRRRPRRTVRSPGSSGRRARTRPHLWRRRRARTTTQSSGASFKRGCSRRSRSRRWLGNVAGAPVATKRVHCTSGPCGRREPTKARVKGPQWWSISFAARQHAGGRGHPVKNDVRMSCLHRPSVSSDAGPDSLSESEREWRLPGKRSKVSSDRRGAADSAPWNRHAAAMTAARSSKDLRWPWTSCTSSGGPGQCCGG